MKSIRAAHVFYFRFSDLVVIGVSSENQVHFSLIYHVISNYDPVCQIDFDFMQHLAG